MRGTWVSCLLGHEWTLEDPCIMEPLPHVLCPVCRLPFEMIRVDGWWVFLPKPLEENAR